MPAISQSLRKLHRRGQSCLQLETTIKVYMDFASPIRKASDASRQNTNQATASNSPNASAVIVGSSILLCTLLGKIRGASTRRFILPTAHRREKLEYSTSKTKSKRPVRWQRFACGCVIHKASIQITFCSCCAVITTVSSRSLFERRYKQTDFV